MAKQFFQEVGLTGGYLDPNLFIRKGVYILLFVDDMLVIGKRAQVNEIKAKIAKKWKCKDLGLAEIFVGFQIKRDRLNQTIQIYQEIYTQKIL